MYSRLTLILTLLALSLPAAAEEDDSKNYDTRGNLKKTRLRAEPPKATFETRRYTIVTKVEARVRNAGNTQARDVKVWAILPNGNRSPMSGPSTLEGYQKEYYTSHPNEIVTTSKKIQIEVSCSNCYR